MKTGHKWSLTIMEIDQLSVRKDFAKFTELKLISWIKFWGLFNVQKKIYKIIQLKNKVSLNFINQIQ